MNGTTRDDIRSLLKEFGVRADEAIVTYMARNQEISSLQLRLSLEDLTDYGEVLPSAPLSLTVEGEVNRKE